MSEYTDRLVDQVSGLEMDTDKMQKTINRLTTECSRRLDAMEIAWGLIANSYGGDWELANKDWRNAAIRWRDNQWHPILNDATQGQSDNPEPASDDPGA